MKTLIYNEILQRRILNKLQEYENNGKAPSQYIIDSLNTIQKQIFEIKARLGLYEDKNKKDAFNYFEKLKKKFKKWLEENQASRTITCLAKGTKILLSDFSVKNIEDIEVGDEIFGVVKIEKQGLQLVKQQVLNKIYQGKKQVLRLKTKKGRNIICTPDHLIYSYMRAKNTKSRQQDYLPAENCLRRRLKIFNYIKNFNNYYKGVLIGFIESDGWIYCPKDKNHPEWEFKKQFNICQSLLSEKKALEWILDYLDIKYTKEYNSNGWGKGAYEYYLKVNNNSFVDGIYSKLFEDKDIALGFLAGFVLGDGTIDKLGNIYIQQKNKNELLKKVFSFLKIDYTVSVNNFGNRISIFSIRKQIPLVIPESKKSKKYLNLLLSKGQHFNEDFIVSLEILEEEQEVYDLTTPTANFIANGFIVHNCPHCSKMILLKMKTDCWEALKHPFFKDKVLYNEHLFTLLREGKITKLDVAKVLQGKEVRTADYVEWLLEKIEKRKEE